MTKTPSRTCDQLSESHNGNRLCLVVNIFQVTGYNVGWTVPTIAQAFHTAEARVRPLSDSCELFIAQNGTGTHFSSSASAFRRVRGRREKRLFASSCLFVRPSICPYLSTQLSLDGFSWNYTLETFMKMGQNYRALCMKT
jgi:hypothetical protein